MQKLDEFIEQLLNDKGVTDIDPDTRATLKEDMKNRLIDQINRNAIMELDDQKAEELVKLVEDPDFTNEIVIIE